MIAARVGPNAPSTVIGKPIGASSSKNINGIQNIQAKT
jgi:hypothetical protein